MNEMIMLCFDAALLFYFVFNQKVKQEHFAKTFVNTKYQFKLDLLCTTEPSSKWNIGHVQRP